MTDGPKTPGTPPGASVSSSLSETGLPSSSTSREPLRGPRGDAPDAVTASGNSPGGKCHQAGLEPWIIGMLHSNDWVVGVVEQMGGGPLRDAARLRGVYNLFPSSDRAAAMKLGPHHDTCDSQVIVMMLGDDGKIAILSRCVALSVSLIPKASPLQCCGS